MNAESLILIDIGLIISFGVALFMTVTAITNLATKYVLFIADILNNRDATYNFWVEVVVIAISWTVFYILTVIKVSLLILTK